MYQCIKSGTDKHGYPVKKSSLLHYLGHNFKVLGTFSTKQLVMTENLSFSIPKTFLSIFGICARL